MLKALNPPAEEKVRKGGGRSTTGFERYVQPVRDSHKGPLIISLFAWLISHQPAVLFSQNKSATSNQPAVLFSQNKPAPAISHQPTEQAE
jgi:hypothetical protein